MVSYRSAVTRPGTIATRVRAWARSALPNALLAVVSTLVGYLILELVFFRVALPFLPFNVRPHLPQLADILLQNTKRGLLPRDYIALLGDSYADGIGDWLLASNGNRSKPFHSANIIHARTKRDVVSFGKGPASSAEGLVLRPAAVFAASACYLYPAIEAPRRLIHYFDETNDIEDNLLFLEYVKRAYGRTDAASVEKFLNERWGISPSWRCHTDFADTLFRMGKFAFQYHVQRKDIRQRTTAANTPVIGGQPVRAGALFGPALTLAAHEIEAAVTVFDPSLAWMRRKFPEAPLTVVYIPSPLSVYAHLLPHPVSARRVHPHMVVAVEDQNGVPAGRASVLRRAAATQPVHGPLDWSHLNEHGYRTLGDLVADRLASGELQGTCDRSTARREKPSLR